jgi:hypothetical protein
VVKKLTHHSKFKGSNQTTEGNGRKGYVYMGSSVVEQSAHDPELEGSNLGPWASTVAQRETKRK